MRSASRKSYALEASHTSSFYNSNTQLQRVRLQGRSRKCLRDSRFDHGLGRSQVEIGPFAQASSARVALHQPFAEGREARRPRPTVTSTHGDRDCRLRGPAAVPVGDSADARRIKELIRGSKAVFLFHTANVESSEFTKAWVHYEVSQASAYDKGLVVFQVAGAAPKMPITYFTDLAPLVPSVPESVPSMQRIARSHVPPLREKPLARAAVGAVGGAVFGPLGAGVGALVGFFTAPKPKLGEVPSLQCIGCKASFRFWGGKPSAFYCPSCLRQVNYQ
jgi:hypothetical protein